MDGGQTKKLAEKHSTEIRRAEKYDLVRKARELREELPATRDRGELASYIQETIKVVFTMDKFLAISRACYSTEVKDQIYGAVGVRKLLATPHNPPIQAVIDANLVPRLIEFAKQTYNSYLKLEAVWALTNIASGSTTQCQSIIQKGGIPVFVSLLSSPDADISEQAIWALGNIAGDCSYYRDMILRAGGLDPLVNIVMSSRNQSVIKHGAWAISNLCRGLPIPSFELIRNSIEPICKVLMMDTGDIELITDCSWALSYLCENKYRVQLVLDTGIVPTLIKLLSVSELKVLVPVLRIIGNLLTGNEAQTNILISIGVIDALEAHLKSGLTIVKREICWSLSNIAGTTKNQVAYLLTRRELINTLVRMLSSEKVEIRTEIMWTIKNICINGEKALVLSFLREYDLIEVLLRQIEPQTNHKYLEIILETLYRILGLEVVESAPTQTERPFYSRLIELGGAAKLEALQEHVSYQVYEKAVSLLEKYFDLESPL